jgi:hypothetical protein
VWRQAMILICVLIVVVDHERLAIPWPNAVAVGTESKACVMENLKLIDVLSITNYQKCSDSHLVISGIIPIGICRAPYGGNRLPWGERHSDRKSFGSFLRPDFRHLAFDIFYSGGKPVQCRRHFYCTRGYDQGSSDRISSISNENFIANTTVVFASIEGRGRLDFLRDNPRSLACVESVAGVVGSFLGDDQRRDNPDRPDRAKNCPYSCDPIKVLGGPVLSRPEISFCGLVLFVGFMYFSNKGLERSPFGAQHIGFWLLAVVAGFVAVLATIPMFLRLVWPLI